jgi:hypothetical protein
MSILPKTIGRILPIFAVKSIGEYFYGQGNEVAFNLLLTRF